MATSGWILSASPQRRQWCWWEDAQSNHRRRPPSVVHSHGCQIYLDLFIFSRLLFWLPISIYNWSSHLSLWVAHQGSCNLGLFVVVVVRLLLVQTTFGIMSTHFKLSVLCPPFWSSQGLWTRPASSWGAFSLFHNHFPSPPPSCQASPCQTPRLCSVETCSHWTCAVLRVSEIRGNCCVNTFEIRHLGYDMITS